MKPRLLRKYPFPDAALILFVRLILARLGRDLGDLSAVFALTPEKLNDLRALCDAFEAMPDDSFKRADISDAVAGKNALRRQIYAAMSRIAGRVKGVWGANSRQFERIAEFTNNLDHCSDNAFVHKSKDVVALAAQWLTDLAGEGQTQAGIDDAAGSITGFAAKLTDIDARKTLRKDASEDRVLAGNALYDLTMKYVGYGFTYYSEAGKAKVEDYILQKFLGNGASSPPSVTEETSYDEETQTLSWKDVATETSYLITITERGVATKLRTKANETSLVIERGRSEKFAMVQAQNAAGLSRFGQVVRIPPAAG